MSIQKLLLIKIAADVDDLKNNIDESKSTIKSLQDGFSNARGVMSGDMTQLEGMFKNLGDGLTTVGTKMTTHITLPLIGLGKLAVDAFTEYESSLTGVAKTFPGTAAEFDKLTAEMDKMATVLPQPISKIHEVAEAAGQLGISKDGILDFTEVMLNLGVSTNMSAEDAATALARMSNIMGTSEADYSRLGSTIVDLGNNYATTESDIVNFSLRLSGAGKQVGMSEADVLGISTALSSLGINAEAGGTAMSKFMSSMSIATERGYDNMKALEKQTGYTGRELEILSKNDSTKFKSIATSVGMTTTELNNVIKANKDLKYMAEIAGVSMEEFSKIFKEDAATALAMFFEGMSEGNIETASSIELLQDMGINEARLRDMILRTTNAKGMFTDALKDARNAWDEDTALTIEAEKRYATFESQMTLLKNEFGLLAVEVGQRLVPTLSKIIDFVKNVSQWIREMPADKFDFWVETLLKLAAAGPIIAIVGKLFTTISQVSSLMSGATKATTGLFELIMGKGSATAKAVTDISTELAVTDGKVSGLIPKLTNLGKKGFGAVNSYMASSTGLLGKVHTVMGTLSTKVGTVVTSMGGLTGILTKVVGPIGIFGTIVGKAATENERLNAMVDAGIIELPKLTNIFGPLGDVISKVTGFLGELGKAAKDGFDKITGGVLGMGDLLTVAASVIALPFAPWLGAAGIAGVAVKGIMGGIAESMYLANYETIYFNEAMNRATEDLAGTQTAFRTLIDGELPQMVEGIRTLSQEAAIARFLPGTESLSMDTEELKTFLEGNRTLVSDSYDTLIAQTQSFHEQNGTLNSVQFNEDMAFLNARKEAELKENGVTNDELILLHEKYHNDKYSLTDEEWVRYQELLAGLDTKAKELQATRDARDLQLLEETLKAKQKMGYTLTQDDIKKIYDSKQKALMSEYELQKTAYAQEQELLAEKFAAGRLSKEEYDIKMQEIAKKNAQDLIGIETTLTKELLKIVTGKNEDEFNEMIRAEEDYIKAQQEYNDKRTKATAGLATELEVLEAQSNMLRLKDTKDKLALTEEQQAAYVEYVENNFAPELRESMGVVKGAFNLDFVKSTLETAKKNMEGYVGQFENTGKHLASGVAEGIKKNTHLAVSAASKMVEAVRDKTNSVMKIMSPSRVMMESGGFIAEGLAVGIEDETPTVIKAAEDMANAVRDSGLSPEDLRMDLSRSILSDVSANATITTDSVFEAAMARVLESTNVTAVIGRNDFDRGVEDKINRDKRRFSTL